MTIGILDYGAGNLKNVCRAVEHLGYEYKLIASYSDLTDLAKLIIPGVGAFKVAMDQLTQLNLVTSIKELAKRDVPILGICLGMQVLFTQSFEFGTTKGLDLISGDLTLIPQQTINDKRHKVPHIGWNELVVDNSHCTLVKNVEENDAVYFVHSYMVSNIDPNCLVAHCKYGELQIPSIVQKGNIFGCQFHPEKSGGVGLNILSQFLSLS